MKTHTSLKTFDWLRLLLLGLLTSFYWTVAGAANPEPAGWYAGDMHVHRSCGGPPESMASLYNKMATNNLAVISLLADMGNGEVQNPITDLPRVTGFDDPISTQGRIVHWDAEWHWDATYFQYAHQALGGHLVALGLNEAHQIWEEYTFPVLDWARTAPNSGIAGFPHIQYIDDGIPQTLNCCLPIEYPVEVALGSADFISEDVMGSDTSIRAYYRLLNTGFRPGFTAGTDYPCGVSELGSLLTYAKVVNGQLTYDNWIEGIKAGRIVVSRNKHNEFLKLTVNGASEPGDEISLTAAADLPVTITWTANKNLSGSIELIQNGVVVASKLASVTASTPATLTAKVNFTKSGWLAARRMDIKGHQTHTGAVFVKVNNAPVRASVDDALFYEQWMDQLLTKTSPGGEWHSYFPTNLVAAQARYLGAKAIYHQIALEASAIPKTLAITTASLPDGVKGLPYSATLSAIGGTKPYTWSITGGLPDGLTVINGAITGTPSVGGLTTLSVQVNDAGNPVQTAYRNINLTIETVPPTSSTLWSITDVPSVTADSDTSAVELGVKFRPSVNGFITGIRFYKAVSNTGSHTGSLWDNSGNLLANAVFTNETASGWQQVTFASPVAINANTIYVASYHTDVGHYSVDTGYFASAGLTNGLLYALRDGENGGNGVYAYGATSSFPNSTYQSSNYWVDPVFTTNSANDTTPPSVPVNLKAAATSVTQVNLKWTASTDNVAVHHYVVERCQGEACGGSSFSQIASPAVNNLNDSGLTPETTYRYRVKAVDAAGNQSGYSVIVTAATTVIATPDIFLFKASVARTVDYAGALGLGVLANDADSRNLPLNAVPVGVIPVGVTLQNTGQVTVNRTTGASFRYRASNGSVLSLPVTGAAVILRLNALPKAIADNCIYNRSGSGSIVSGSACVMAGTRVFSMNLKANDTDPNMTSNKPSDGVGDAITGAIITATGTGVSVSANPACGQAAIGTSNTLAQITNRCNGILTVTVSATATASPIKFNYKALDDLNGASAAVINTVTVQ